MAMTLLENGETPSASTTVELAHFLTIDFATADASTLPANWEAPEQGRRWARGRQSVLNLPRPREPGHLLLLLTVDVFAAPPLLQPQTLRVLVNGRTVRLASVRMSMAFACLIEEELIAGSDVLAVTLEHPSVVQPSMISASSGGPGHSIGFVELTLLRCVSAATLAVRAPDASHGIPPPLEDLSDTNLMMRFASIGDNCEFGMVQRAYGAEPMDLLRFIGAAGHRHAGLMRGLETGFAGIETLQDLEFELYPAEDGREYVLHQRQYDFQSHTWVIEGTSTVERLYRREHRKLALLRRLYTADVEAAERIFVYKRNDPVDPAAIVPILKLLRRRAPNALLFVTVADVAHQPGTVKQYCDGMMIAYIDRFNPYDNAKAAASELWAPICRRAYGMWRSQRLVDIRQAETARNATGA